MNISLMSVLLNIIIKNNEMNNGTVNITSVLVSFLNLYTAAKQEIKPNR